MSRGFVLLPSAETDLRSTIRYTRQQWGGRQAGRYAAALRRCIEKLTAKPTAYRDLSDLFPGLRMVHCQHHFIFCLPRENEPTVIVAILHEKMDLMARLAGRLG